MTWLYRLIERLDGERHWRIIPYKMAQRIKMILLSLIVSLIMGICLCPIYAQDININKLADAIYKAEGGAKTNYPYGILAHYKTTTPRQACINTIKHALKDFKNGDFIAFLGSRYCPIGCDNDRGTNKYWIKNVKRLYNESL